MKIAIIGAGVSGLACARALTERGHAPVLFDKARGPWGRLATRRLDSSESGWDVGAQYFTARTPAFQAVVATLAAEGVVAPWHGVIAALDGAGRSRPAGGDTRWVGVPGMSALGLALGRGQTIQTNVHVARIDRHGAGFAVIGETGANCGHFDAVVVATPAPQAAALVAGCAPALGVALAGVAMEPCWAGLVSFSRRVDVPWDGAFTDAASAVLGWVARDGSKPGRPAGERWVLHARSDWSAGHLEASPDTIGPLLLQAFDAIVGLHVAPSSGMAAVDIKAHRWRFARGHDSRAGANLRAADGALVACGDWAAGGRVEGAYLSGLAAAEDVLGRTTGTNT